MSLSRGRFIVLEGIDGAGTTTQLVMLRDWMAEQGSETHATFEPSAGPIGSYIRTILRGEDTAPPHDALALLFAADRLDHIAREVEPVLARGEHVLSDRYVGSSLAYQGSQSGYEWVEQLNARAMTPDLVLFLRIDPEIALARITERDGARRELFEHRELLERIAAGYDTIYHEPSGARAREHSALEHSALEHSAPVVVIDATQSIEAVFDECCAAIEPLLQS